MKNLILVCGMAIFLVSCETDYRIPMGSRTSNSTYIGEKIYNKQSGKTQVLAPDIKQLLMFEADTMQIIRNDTIIERFSSYGSKNWIGKRKYGKVLFSGLSKQGRKSFVIEIIDPKEPVYGDIIIGTIMQGNYDDKKDTTQTYYKSSL